MQRVRLVVPVYNDWTSFSILLGELDKEAASLPFRIFVSAIDDGSSEASEPELSGCRPPVNLEGVEIVHLLVNLGHQRAIAVGLCLAVDDADSDAVLVMDADGEDPPHTIKMLTETAARRSDFCIVARRRRREETLVFKTGYRVYKFVFKLFTGKTIDFGNFSLFSIGYARRLVIVSELWNNLPAAVLHSRLPITPIAVDRGRRYAGQSKMNMTSLIMHGLSGISVYADTIFVRLLLLSLFLAVVSVIIVSTLLVLRIFFPAHATPGWATTISFGLIIIILQILFTALSSALTLLNSRVQKLVQPIADFRSFIGHRSLLWGQRFSSPRASALEP
ncbi:MAG: glycosyltransferase [Acidobacteriota bacterium]|nr:glycosyltransferase [Acidobacteriota bacterium]